MTPAVGEADAKYFASEADLSFSIPSAGATSIIDRFTNVNTQVAASSSVVVREFTRRQTVRGLAGLVHFRVDLSSAQRSQATMGLLAGLGAAGAATTNKTEFGDGPIFTVQLPHGGQTISIWIGRRFECISASALPEAALAVTSLLVRRVSSEHTPVASVPS